MAALEKRVIRLEEENRVLRQRDIMHRMIDLEGSTAEGSSAAKAAPAAPAVAAKPAAAPELKFAFSRSNLITFDPVALEKPGFEMIVQSEHAELETKLKRQQSERLGPRASRRRWFALRGPGMLLGGLLSKRGKGSVHPYSPGKSPSASGRASGRANELANLEQSAREAIAVRRIQLRWREKVERDEEYWEMMGYY